MLPLRSLSWKRSSSANSTRTDPSLRTSDHMSELHIDVKYVAHLARLELSPDEVEKLGKQLDDVLDYVTKLKEVDVTGVEPTAHPFPLVNVIRADEPTPSLPHEQALANAPSKANGLFLVPKIVE